MNKPFLTLLSTFLFLSGCNSVTRTKSATESEKTAKETAIEQTTTAKVDSLVSETTKEVISTAETRSRELETESATRIIDIEILETFFNEMQDQPKSGMSVHPPTGRTIRTTKRIQEQINITKEKEVEMYKDTVIRQKEFISQITTDFETKLSISETEKIELQSELNELRKSKPNCWRCYIIPLIVLLLIVAGYFALKRYRII
jgi:hypothetical protein